MSNNDNNIVTLSPSVFLKPSIVAHCIDLEEISFMNDAQEMIEVEQGSIIYFSRNSEHL